MGSCLSCFSESQQTNQQGNAQPSYAAVASAAVHAVADIISDNQGAASPTQHAPPAGTSTIKDAYVFKVPDGDTFTCDYYNQNGEKLTGRVRIMGIDCPETKQNYGYVFQSILSTILNFGIR